MQYSSTASQTSSKMTLNYTVSLIEFKQKLIIITFMKGEVTAALLNLIALD